jgi:hypothetical protein
MVEMSQFVPVHMGLRVEMSIRSRHSTPPQDSPPPGHPGDQNAMPHNRRAPADRAPGKHMIRHECEQ